METTTPLYRQEFNQAVVNYLNKSALMISLFSLFICTLCIGMEAYQGVFAVGVADISWHLLPLFIVLGFGITVRLCCQLSWLTQVFSWGKVRCGISAYFLALLTAWLYFFNAIIDSSTSGVIVIKACLELFLLAFAFCCFPSRWLFIVCTIALTMVHSWVQYTYNSVELLFPVLRVISYLSIVILGIYIMNKWFTQAIKQHVENKQLLAEMEQLAITDALTGLYNRRYFDQQLAHEILQAQRSGSPLSLIVFDVDYFKPYNDTLGHVEGDKCLQHIAHILQTLPRRPRDVMARFGGEEFVIILPDTALAGAIHVAEKIKAALAQQCIAHPSSPISDFVTISQGVVVFDYTDDAKSILQRADALLYKAKQAHRNTIMF